jgi:hypothetical protein
MLMACDGFEAYDGSCMGACMNLPMLVEANSYAFHHCDSSTALVIG